MTNIYNESFHQSFIASKRRHVLMITNHGIHQWDIIPGLPDTGGQNVFVNQLAESLERHGLKITIVNRGGYPHPMTGEPHSGVHYKNENCRILYVEDGTKAFVRKEQMKSHLDELSENLFAFVRRENIAIDLIVSHYWDGAQLGALLNLKLVRPLPHVWIPHSLGSLKKRNMDPSTWAQLNIDERIGVEREVAHTVDAIADTSVAIREALANDYHATSTIFLPPCVITDRFFPFKVLDRDEIWSFLSARSGLPEADIQRCRIITEISRTDKTKRKNVLVDAFCEVHRAHPDTFLIVAIDANEAVLYRELLDRIAAHGIASHVAVIGNESERLPTIYNISDVYCSPSVMEGFGMSVQEAAATGVPVVGSALIPFVSEYLIGREPVSIMYTGEDGAGHGLELGAGAFMVAPDDVTGFAVAIEHLIKNDPLRKKMGKAAYNITIPYFTWDVMVETFLGKVFSDKPTGDGEPTTRTSRIPIAV